MKILKYVVAEDCGRIINPMIVDGQVHGGVAQGIGAALFEELVYDEDGQLLSASLVDYVIPSAAEVPDMDVVHIESESAVAGGFRGMGEGGTIGAPAAIANAIADALSPLDIDVSILPMTPERIFRLHGASRTENERKSRMNDLAGRVALVTGGGRDVGAAISTMLAAAGASGRGKLSQFEGRGGGRRRADPEGRRQGQGLSGGHLQIPKPSRGMVASVKADFGGLDILVNNAGLVLRKRFNETTPEDWHRQIDTCLYGAIHCCHAAAPLLEASGRGRIISIMGDSSRVGESGLAHWSGGARGHHCAHEIAGAGNGDEQGDGQFDRARPDRDRARQGWVDANRDKLVKAYAIRRLGLPSDVAPMVALLASDAGSWITGQVISISGGFSMV